jgi:hypothetical protein
MPDVLQLPPEYSYVDVLPRVIDQGDDPICVPCSISSYLNWRENLSDGVSRDNGINLFEIYNMKTTDGDGMTFKEAFRYLRHHGVFSDKGLLKIGEYAMLRNNIEFRYSIFANGPCFAALPVYNSNSDFWNRYAGQRLRGYHAISVVGYDETGLIIRNSWGRDFGDNGYTHINYEDTGKMLEAWSIVS